MSLKFIGALYLDQGLETVWEFLKEIVYPKINEGAFSHVMDYKSQLQELIQRDGSGNVEYQILQEKDQLTIENLCHVLR